MKTLSQLVDSARVARRGFKCGPLRIAAVFACLSLGAFQCALASVHKEDSGYRVTYSMQMQKATPTGEDVKGVVIIEWNDTRVSLRRADGIAASGHTKFSDIVDFHPTSSMVLGYLDAKPGVGDEKRHLYMLANTDFATDKNGELSGKKFSQIFGVGEQATIDLVARAAEDDPAAREQLVAMARGALSPAAFDPAGGFRVMHWSAYAPPVGLPEPSTLVLAGLALAGLALSRKRRQS